MEARDGLLGAGHAGLLAADDAQIVHRGVELLGIGSGFADAHVDDDLVEARDFVDVVDREFLLKLRNDLGPVLFLQTRCSHRTFSFSMN